MASIVKRTRKDGGASYHVKSRAGDGRVRWEHVPGDKRAAKARARQIEDELYKTGGRWTPPAPKKVREYADEWLENHAVSPRVRENYSRTFRLVLKPELGNLELAAVTRVRMKRLVATLRERIKAHNTIRNDLIPIREMFASAVEDGLISANPAGGLTIGDAPKRKVYPPTKKQMGKLIENAREEAREALIVATVTGLRRGELFALRWEDVDFGKRTIHVHATNHAGRVSEQTKTEAGERFVPLFESARKVLAARKLRTGYDEPRDFVFGTVIGTATEPGNFVRREFKTAQQRAGLGQWINEDGKRRWAGEFRFHDLRHYAVSPLIEQGADIKLLQAIAGHASATVTLDTYGHLMTERVTEAATRYDPLEGRREVDATLPADGSPGRDASIQAVRGVAQPG
jgi:integrase